MYTFMYATPTFITEEFHLVTQVQLLLTMVTVNYHLIQRWFTLIGLICMTHFNSTATSTTVTTMTLAAI